MVSGLNTTISIMWRIRESKKQEKKTHTKLETNRMFYDAPDSTHRTITVYETHRAQYTTIFSENKMKFEENTERILFFYYK